MRYCLFVLSLLCFLITSARADQNDFISKNYLIQQRISHGLVFDIIQDRLGYMWFATEHGLIRFDGIEMVEFRYDPLDENSISSDAATAIAEDHLGNLWVGTMYSGLNYYVRNANRFIRYPVKKDSCSISANKINKIVISNDQKIWISTEGGGLCSFIPEVNCFNSYRRPQLLSNFTDAIIQSSDGSIWTGNYLGINRKINNSNEFDSLAIWHGQTRIKIIKVIAEDSNQHIWLGTQYQGLFKWNQKDSVLTNVPLTINNNLNAGIQNIWDLLIDANQVIWVGTDDGLVIIKNGKAPEKTVFNIENESKRVLSIFQSREGVVWLGTNAGIIVLTPRLKPFDLIKVHQPISNVPSSTGISFITTDHQQRIWTGTLKGLFTFDPINQIFNKNYLKNNPGLSKLGELTIASFYEDKSGNYWIGTIKDFNSAFEVFQYQSGKDLLIPHSVRCESFKLHVTQQILEDHLQNIWYANGAGLVRYDTRLNKFITYKANPTDSNSIGGNYINRLFLDSDQRLWIGTNDAGLQEYKYETNSFKRYPYKAGDYRSLSDKRILHFLEAKNKKLWIATVGGLNLFDPQKNTFVQFFKKDGLIDDHINGTVEDDEGYLWLSSPKALSRYHPISGEWLHFDNKDGLLQTEFWDRTAIKTNEHKIYFGGEQGLVIFDPTLIKLNPYHGKVLIHDLYILNQLQKPGHAKSVLNRDISQTSLISLQHSENIVSFRFGALNYIRPDKIKYAIKMEGFEADWQYIGNRRDATYTNLNPGNYTFRLRATNNDGIWNPDETKLFISILSPWWASIVARIVYLFLFAGILWIIYRFLLNRQILTMEANRLKEIGDFKTKFYTNITHEFRTPLTLILGPVEKAIKSKNHLVLSDLIILQRNAKRLQTLINQLLKLGKIESGHLSVNYNQQDIVAFLTYLTESFQSYAQVKNILLYFTSPVHSLFMDIDREKLMEIISNVVSNGLKFTPDGGIVHIHLDTITSGNSIPEKIIIHIEDTGIGIAQDKLPFLFDRYFSSDNSIKESTGIGLALSKELTTLLGGEISVISTVNKGSVFSLKFPVSNQSPIIHTLEPLNEDHSQPLILNTSRLSILDEQINRPLVLIVEDNQDMAHYIRSCIESDYRVRISHDGFEGYSQALTLIPDLILSDVMMAGLDGFELTNKLKTDKITSHIPIILITAKADDISRIEGLRKRADAYMVKPFNQEELLLIMDNLLEARKQLQSWYRLSWNNPNPLPIPEIKPLEHEYIQRLRVICEKHISDSSFSIEDLCREIGMSHSQIHRKMVAITGESVQKFFQRIRLEKAQELLLSTEKTIAEIAYETGFSEPAYFTKVFVKFFKTNPSIWRKKENT